jgi:hypothetical protein
MPYSVGEFGSYGCSGYPVVKDGTSEVMGCHETMAQAQNQISAINMSEAESRKKRLPSGVEGFIPASDNESILVGAGIKNPEPWPGTRVKTEGAMGQPHPASTKPSVFRKPKKKKPATTGSLADASGAIATTGGGTGMGTKSDDGELQETSPITQRHEFKEEILNRDSINDVIGKEDSRIQEGDFVMGETTEGLVHGVVEHIMWEGGVYGQPGTDYAIESNPDNPAMAVRVYEADMNEDWVPTAYSVGMMYNDAVVVDMEEHEMDEEMEYMLKQEAYSPNDGMKAAARTAIKWKEEGKAKGAGTPVGWGRARDIVAGRSMSLSVVKRMYSFFSRHEVDKQGKGFNPGSEGYPSKGRVMWNAWGGDAGFAWSRAIVKRNEDKALFSDFGKDYTKVSRMHEIFKAESVRVGQMVSWNSSGGRATGKVKRVITSGSYNVPDSDFTINGTSENPAVVITLYRNGKPTDTTVAHRMSSLRAL